MAMGLGDLVQNDYKCYSVLLDVIKGGVSVYALDVIK